MSLFQNVVRRRPRKNVFNLSHERKFTFNPAMLTPILCEEVIPGDTWRLNTETMIRLAPMIAPVMHRMNVYTHYFFVPNRIIWDDWEDFITGGEDGEQEPIMPYFSLNGISENLTKAGSLIDYLGMATSEETPTGSAQFSALALRAYQTIYNEYYRDQNLEEEIPISKGSGNVTIEITDLAAMRYRAWEKDYFTSALPWTQRGAEVNIPVSGDAPVYLKEAPFDTEQIFVDSSGDPFGTGAEIMHTGGTAQLYSDSVLPPNNNGWIDPAGTMEADLSATAAVTIEELRTAARLQEWLETSARGGSRYVEQLLAFFDEVSPDARLQRPEFLGGGKSPVVISEVLQTSKSDDSGIEISPQGNMAGHGISVGNTHQFKRHFTEHGYIIGIMSVLPRSTYQQGTRKHYLKNDKFDYFFHHLAQLGEQPVDVRELYDDYSLTEEKTFGYQSRYCEYKYIPSSVHGEFKNSLDFWHMGRKFDEEPVLNNQFIKVEEEAWNKVFALTAEDETHHLYAQLYNNIKAIRKMPRFNDPKL